MTTPLPQPAPGSDWTVETLRQHMLEQLGAIHRELDQRDLRYQQRYDSQTQALEAARLAMAKANEVALSAAEKATAKTETASNERFASVNEFRGQLSDQARTFLPRPEAAIQFESLVMKIEALAAEHRRDMVSMREMADRMAAGSDDRLKKLEAAGANLQGRMWALGTGIALVVVIVNVAIRFIQ